MILPRMCCALNQNGAHSVTMEVHLASSQFSKGKKKTCVPETTAYKITWDGCKKNKIL